MLQRTALVFLTLFLLACDESVPGGEITIRNDILDKEFNSFSIDQVKTSDGSKLFSASLVPGKEIALPYKNITDFRITRHYDKFSRVYQVSCPPHFDKRLMMKLIDIHSNRLGGGCELARYGEIRGGITKWQD